MYNFRYHLVTICAIFIALALGLVLGAGLSASEFAQDTSDNMISDLFAKYEQVEQQSAAVEKENATLSALSKSFADDWQTDRLSGRVIAVLTYTDEESQALAKEQSDLIAAGGGTAVTINFAQPNLNSTDKEIATQLEKIVKPAQESTLNATLASTLAAEWSLPLAKETASGHALTTYLLSAKLITVSQGDLAALNSLAVDQGIKTPKITGPVGINGIIDLLASYDESDTAAVDSVGLALANDYQSLGQAGKLPYYVAKSTTEKSKDSATVSAASAAASVEKDASYFALVAQSGELGSALATAAGNTSAAAAQTPVLSSVVLAENQLWAYSVIALLSGGKIGSYDLSKPDTTEYPALPTDTIGTAAFPH